MGDGREEELKAQWHAKFQPNATKHSGVMGCQSWTGDVTVFKAEMNAVDELFVVVVAGY